MELLRSLDANCNLVIWPQLVQLIITPQSPDVWISNGILYCCCCQMMRLSPQTQPKKDTVAHVSPKIPAALCTLNTHLSRVSVTLWMGQNGSMTTQSIQETCFRKKHFVWNIWQIRGIYFKSYSFQIRSNKKIFLMCILEILFSWNAAPGESACQRQRRSS